MNNQQPQTRDFTVDGLTFSSQIWGNPNGIPVIALHGWLDNSASFFKLAPLLDSCYIVAIDMAGHGKTDHRLGSFPYNIWEDVAEIFAIADQLGWEKFALMGHSRGGIIAALAAGTFPERITHLALIEGILPEYTNGKDAPKQLALSIQGIKNQSQKQRTLYANIETAVVARENGMFPLSHEAAKALTLQGVVQTEKGYHWSTDQRLLAPSSVKLLPDQIFAFINHISAPIHLVLATEGMPKMYPNYMEFVKGFSHVKYTLLEGGHHLHMEEQVEDVANVFRQSLFT